MSDPIEKWDYFELKLSASTLDNPFRDVSFEAEFADEPKVGTEAVRGIRY